MYDDAKVTHKTCVIELRRSLANHENLEILCNVKISKNEIDPQIMTKIEIQKIRLILSCSNLGIKISLTDITTNTLIGYLENLRAKFRLLSDVLLANMRMEMLACSYGLRQRSLNFNGMGKTSPTYQNFNTTISCD